MKKPVLALLMTLDSCVAHAKQDPKDTIILVSLAAYSFWYLLVC